MLKFLEIPLKLSYIIFIFQKAAGINNLDENPAAGACFPGCGIEFPREEMYMLLSRCKKSVFCILFLLCYFLGTICGVLLFRFLAGANDGWVRRYSAALFCETPDGWNVLFSFCRPLLLAAAAGMLSCGNRLIVWLIVLRGALTAYAAAAAWAAGCSLTPLLMRGIILMPLFFAVCRWAYYRNCPADQREKMFDARIKL